MYYSSKDAAYHKMTSISLMETVP